MLAAHGMKTSWLQIDLGVLKENIRSARSAVRDDVSIIFIVKANAYGHGIVPVARAAVDAGIDWLGVAYQHEAAAIREQLDRPDILLLGAADASDVEWMHRHRVTPILVSRQHGLALAQAARAAGLRLAAHLKIDTGMGRLGVPWEKAPDICRELASVGGLDIRGLCSHFATVEPSLPDRAGIQLQRFMHVTGAIERTCGASLMKHISSSRALLYYETWDLNAVRAGIVLYGYGSTDERMRFHTRPFLEWKSCVMQVKDVPAGFPVGYYSTHVTREPTRLAVIAAGYADGYHRALSNRGHVLIRGKRCQVVGRVSMNWITADVGRDATVEEGDEVVLIGRQGGEEIWAGELAKICRTIPYEMLVGIDHHAERRFVDTAGA